jgi:hypothetical protein
MDRLKFTVLDDASHIIGPGEYTVCGLAIPFGNGYATDQPKKVCPDCRKRAKETDEFGVTGEAFEDAQPETPLAAPEEAPKAKAKSGDKA